MNRDPVTNKSLLRVSVTLSASSTVLAALSNAKVTFNFSSSNTFLMADYYTVTRDFAANVSIDLPVDISAVFKKNPRDVWMTINVVQPIGIPYYAGIPP